MTPGKEGEVLLPFEDLPPVSPATEAAPKATRADAKARAASLNHEDLTRLGARWLRNHSFISFRECGSIYGSEIADVIGWHGRGTSILLECKRTRADFLRDKEKTFRRYEEFGYGCFRYYLCPAGLLEAKDMPAKWGLLWAYENKVVKVKTSELFDPVKAAVAEKKLLAALLYRIENDLRAICEQTGKPLPSRINL